MVNVKWYKNILGFKYAPENETKIEELSHLNLELTGETERTKFGVTTLLTLQEMALSRLSIGRNAEGWFAEWHTENNQHQYTMVEFSDYLENATEIRQTNVNEVGTIEQVVNVNKKGMIPFVALTGIMLVDFAKNSNVPSNKNKELINNFVNQKPVKITQEEFDDLSKEFLQYIHGFDNTDFMQLNYQISKTYPIIEEDNIEVLRNSVLEWFIQGEVPESSRNKTRIKKSVAERLQEFASEYGLCELSELSEEQFKNNALNKSLMENIQLPKDFEFLLKNISKGGVRNVLLQGEPGTGKSFLTRILASALNLAHTQELGSSEKIYATDWFATLVPRTDDIVEFVNEDNVLDVESLVEKQGGLPSLFEMKMLPKKVYKKLTGNEFNGEDNPSEEELFKLYDNKRKEIYNKVINDLNKKRVAPTNNSDFVMVYTELGKALIEGNTVIDLQEIDTMRNMDSISFLYEMLEEGWVSLPNGTRVQKHPNTIVCFTINGVTGGSITKELPTAFMDRMELGLKFWEMQVDEMVKRIKSSIVRKGEIPDRKLIEMAQIVISVKNTITSSNLNGYVGYRSYQNWVKAYLNTGDAYNSALLCVFNKATDEKDELEKLITNYLDNSTFHN